MANWLRAKQTQIAALPALSLRWFSLAFKTTDAILFEISAKAARKYTPGPYHGHIVLLRSQGTAVESKSDWSKLAVGDLEVYELPGAHLDPIKGPLSRLGENSLRAAFLKPKKLKISPLH